MIKEKDKMPEGDKKESVKKLLTLEDSEFKNITNYDKIKYLEETIKKINDLITKNAEDLKKEYLDEYNKYVGINNDFKLEIAGIDNNPNFAKEIGEATEGKLGEIRGNLDEIKKKIDNGLKGKEDELIAKSNEIKLRIDYFKEQKYVELGTIEEDQKNIDLKLRDKVTTNIDPVTVYKISNEKLDDIKTKVEEKYKELKEKYEKDIFPDLEKKCNEIKKSIINIKEKIEEKDGKTKNINISKDINMLILKLTYEEIVKFKDFNAIYWLEHDIKFISDYIIKKIQKLCEKEFKEIETKIKRDEKTYEYNIDLEKIKKSVKEIKNNISTITTLDSKKNFNKKIKDLEGKINEEIEKAIKRCREKRIKHLEEVEQKYKELTADITKEWTLNNIAIPDDVKKDFKEINESFNSINKEIKEIKNTSSGISCTNHIDEVRKKIENIIENYKEECNKKYNEFKTKEKSIEKSFKLIGKMEIFNSLNSVINKNFENIEKIKSYKDKKTIIDEFEKSFKEINNYCKDTLDFLKDYPVKVDELEEKINSVRIDKGDIMFSTYNFFYEFQKYETVGIYISKLKEQIEKVKDQKEIDNFKIKIVEFEKIVNEQYNFKIANFKIIITNQLNKFINDFKVFTGFDLSTNFSANKEFPSDEIEKFKNINTILEGINDKIDKISTKQQNDDISKIIKNADKILKELVEKYHKGCEIELMDYFDKYKKIESKLSKEFKEDNFNPKDEKYRYDFMITKIETAKIYNKKFYVELLAETKAYEEKMKEDIDKLDKYKKEINEKYEKFKKRNKDTGINIYFDDKREEIVAKITEESEEEYKKKLRIVEELIEALNKERDEQIKEIEKIIKDKLTDETNEISIKMRIDKLKGKYIRKKDENVKDENKENFINGMLEKFDIYIKKITEELNNKLDEIKEKNEKVQKFKKDNILTEEYKTDDKKIYDKDKGKKNNVENKKNNKDEYYKKILVVKGEIDKLEAEMNSDKEKVIFEEIIKEMKRKFKYCSDKFKGDLKCLKLDDDDILKLESDLKKNVEAEFNKYKGEDSYTSFDIKECKILDEIYTFNENCNKKVKDTLHEIFSEIKNKISEYGDDIEELIIDKKTYKGDKLQFKEIEEKIDKTNDNVTVAKEILGIKNVLNKKVYEIIKSYCEECVNKKKECTNLYINAKDFIINIDKDIEKEIDELININIITYESHNKRDMSITKKNNKVDFVNKCDDLIKKIKEKVFQCEIECKELGSNIIVLYYNEYFYFFVKQQFDIEKIFKSGKLEDCGVYFAKTTKSIKSKDYRRNENEKDKDFEKRLKEIFQLKNVQIHFYVKGTSINDYTEILQILENIEENGKSKENFQIIYKKIPNTKLLSFFYDRTYYYDFLHNVLYKERFINGIRYFGIVKSIENCNYKGYCLGSEGGYYNIDKRDKLNTLKDKKEIEKFEKIFNINQEKVK